MKHHLPHSPNPQSFVEACRKLGPRMLEVVAAVANDPKARTSQRLAAANSILDRGFGKSTQNLNLVVDDTAAPGLLADLGTVERQQLLLTMQRTIEASAPTTSTSKGRPRTKDVTPATTVPETPQRPLTGLTAPAIDIPDAPARPIPPERPIQGPPEPKSWDRWAVVDPALGESDGPTVAKARRSQPGAWGRARG